MKGKGLWIFLGIVVILIFWSISTYNSLVNKEEEVNRYWSEVQAQYQRRLDLIPNLVNTVKGYAEHEKETFTAVTEARAKAGGVIQLSAKDLSDPAKVKAFQEAQASLSGALQRLLVMVERYPELKANQNFLSLQSQLEGTENRIAVARRRFIGAVKEFNKSIRKFPTVIFASMFGFERKAYFEAESGAEKAPKVEF
ncbi:MAG: LemA family protein [Calditrichia bacterium]